MFDIGLGEILLLAAVGLLVFGPDRLPKAAADAARMMRNVRAMATNARKDLTDAAGVDLSDAHDALRDIASLHPKNLMAGVFDDAPSNGSAAANGSAAGNGSAAANGTASAQGSAPASGAAARFDPDAT